MPKYRENPEDHEVIKYIYNKLRQQGCDENEEIIVELKAKYVSIASAINDSLRQSHYAENPATHAKDLYDDGQYSKAIEKYREAAEKEADNDKKALLSYCFHPVPANLPSIGQPVKTLCAQPVPVTAGANPICSSEICTPLRPAPVATMVTLAGEAVLAAIDKYAQARNVDSSVADEASRRIGRISGAKPTGEDIHLRGKSWQN